jgi:hypothetical protein
LIACSSSDSPRDQNWGSDAGRDYDAATGGGGAAGSDVGGSSGAAGSGVGGDASGTAGSAGSGQAGQTGLAGQAGTSLGGAGGVAFKLDFVGALWASAPKHWTAERQPPKIGSNNDGRSQRLSTRHTES